MPSTTTYRLQVVVAGKLPGGMQDRLQLAGLVVGVGLLSESRQGVEHSVLCKEEDLGPERVWEVVLLSLQL